MTMNSFQPNWSSKPGNTILDILRERNITHEAFVEQMCQPEECIHRLINGEASITVATASQLTKVLGASEQFWLNRQRQYQDSLSRLKKIEEDRWLRDIPYKEILALGWLDDNGDKFETCLRFFGVQTIEEWKRIYEYEISEMVSFRTSPTFKSQISSLACWLRQGEIIGNTIDCKPWNAAKFENSLGLIRQLTKEKNPRRFLPQLKAICAESGVAIAIIPTPKGCRASGAVRFMSTGRALLMLSFRYLSDDQFWFTFFHEAGHLLLHEGKSVFLEGVEPELGILQPNSSIIQQEDEANHFAGELLIPYQFYSRLRRLRGNKREIISFAMEIGVSPGIVVGQMQHYGFIKRSYLNSFKRRYNWDDIFSR